MQRRIRIGWKSLEAVRFSVDEASRLITCGGSDSARRRIYKNMHHCQTSAALERLLFERLK